MKAAVAAAEEEEVKVELEIERGAIISPVSQSVRLQRESCYVVEGSMFWNMAHVCFLSSGASRLR